MVWKKLISVKRPLSIEPTDTIQLSCVCVCARARVRVACVCDYVSYITQYVCYWLCASVRAYLGMCVCARLEKTWKHWYGASQDSPNTTNLWQFERISVKRTVQLTTCIIYVDRDHSLYSGEVKQCILSSAHICVCRACVCVCLCARVRACVLCVCVGGGGGGACLHTRAPKRLKYENIGM